MHMNCELVLQERTIYPYVTDILFNASGYHITMLSANKPNHYPEVLSLTF
jgi:hypothetical protein